MCDVEGEGVNEGGEGEGEDRTREEREGAGEDRTKEEREEDRRGPD